MKLLKSVFEFKYGIEFILLDINIGRSYAYWIAIGTISIGRRDYSLLYLCWTVAGFEWDFLGLNSLYETFIKLNNNVLTNK